MNGVGAGRVIHLVPPNGGGVDRFVRDLVAHRALDWIVHVSESQAVVELPGGPFVPLARGALDELAAAGALGCPAALHAHAATPQVRELAEALHAVTGAPCVLTLHDIGFDDAAAGAAEHAERLRFARAATVRTAPSRYIVERAQAALGAGAPCRRVENGVDAPAPVERDMPGAPPGPVDVAVIGALGEHKGLVALLETAALLPPGLRVVIVGYTAQQLMPGWALPQRVWMHGVFELPALPALVRHYGARLAFFPPGMPESYCYALSDAWLAGLPALVPDHGALGERVRRHGGGAVYDPALPPAPLAQRIAAQLAVADPDAARRAAATLCPVRTMVAAMNGIYDEVGSEEVRADEARLRAQAQTHLDTRFFRKELLRLQGELQAAADERVHLRAQIEQQRRATERLTALEHEAGEARARFDAERAALTQQRDEARARHAALVARLTRPLRLLPPALRELVIRLGQRLLP